jgi:large subunit ribosomal protein L29
MREIAKEDFAAQITDTRKEIVELRFQLAARKLENTAKLRAAKKRLARLLTVQSENEKGIKHTPKATKAK